MGVNRVIAQVASTYINLSDLLVRKIPTPHFAHNKACNNVFAHPLLPAFFFKVLLPPAPASNLFLLFPSSSSSYFLPSSAPSFFGMSLFQLLSIVGSF
ncbi:Uncharacterized protein HZ326_24819 [Fusarium oxysporum f. sp. albedinis]|nr:Uncharacterized protein HZ326_24819 [Fusarium oxysporum f. sp. albedinis]